jgi:hypothetical protein
LDGPKSENPQWVATERPQRGQPNDSSPAFIGNGPVDNWLLQEPAGDPWNAVGMVVATPVGGQKTEREGNDSWSTQAEEGSFPSNTNQG